MLLKDSPGLTILFLFSLTQLVSCFSLFLGGHFFVFWKVIGWGCFRVTLYYTELDLKQTSRSRSANNSALFVLRQVVKTSSNAQAS